MPFTFLWVEFVYTLIATILYIIAFIVILAGFGKCAGFSPCDARIAAGVSLFIWHMRCFIILSKKLSKR